MPDRERRLAAILLAVTVAWTLALGLLGSTEALLFCAPALLLALPLAFRRYVGESVLDSARERLAHRSRRGETPEYAPSGLPVSVLPRGGRLIASSLAKRPPPFLPSPVL